MSSSWSVRRESGAWHSTPESGSRTPTARIERVGEDDRFTSHVCGETLDAACRRLPVPPHARSHSRSRIFMQSTVHDVAPVLRAAAPPRRLLLGASHNHPTQSGREYCSKSMFLRFTWWAQSDRSPRPSFGTAGWPCRFLSSQTGRSRGPRSSICSVASSIGHGFDGELLRLHYVGRLHGIRRLRGGCGLHGANRVLAFLDSACPYSERRGW